MQGNVEILYEGKFIRLVSNNGWEYIQRTNCNGIAVIVALSEEGRVLLVEQYRVPVASNVLELPAGLIDDGEGAENESGLTAAKRELLEETGYVSERWHEAFSGPGGAGASSDILNFYVALQARKTGSGGGDATEQIRVHEVPLKEVHGWLAQKCSDGIPADPKIYAGLYLLSLYNKISD